MKYLPAVIVAVVLAAIGGVFHVRDSRALAEARGATTVAVAEARLAVQAMDDAFVYAEGQKWIADTAVKLAVSAAERAKRLEARGSVLPRVYPDSSCTKALAIADSTASAWQEAYVHEHAATEVLVPALDTTLRTGAALATATTRVNTAATALVKASRPSFFARLKPDIGFGAAAGIDPFTRKPSTTIGVTLSWRLF